MRRDVERSLKFAVCLLVILSYLALSTSHRYGVEILLVPLAAILLMPIGEWLDRRGPSFRRLTSVVTFLYVISLPILWTMINLLDAVTALVVYIQIYTLIHVKKQRNYDHLVLMSFFLLLAASVMSPTPSIGVVFVLYAITTVWVLMLLEMFAAAERSMAKSAIDIIDRGAKETPLQGQPLRLFDGRVLAAVGICAVAVVFMTGALFFASPRMEAGILGAQDPEMFQTGLSDEVDLSGGGTITRNTTAVMRVTFPDLEDGVYPGEMFWRSTAFDSYTGTGWTRRGLTTARREEYAPREFQRFSSRYGQDVAGGVYRLEFWNTGLTLQEIFLDQTTEGALPALPLVQAVEPSEGQKGIRIRWDRANDFTVALNQRGGTSIHYRAWSEVYEPTPDELRASSRDYSAIMDQRDYDLLTSHTLEPRTQDLARQLTANAETVFDQIIALQMYLGGADFQYTLDVPEHAAHNPVDDFVHNTRTGHCQLYASALALMTRSLGIPARVVNGYRGGRYDSGDQSYTVTADMAHLWVEVFFSDHGWVIFDPSPPGLEYSPFTLSALRRELSRFLLKGKLVWYQNIVGFTPENRLANLRNVTVGLFRSDRQLPDQPVAETDRDLSLFGHLLTMLPAAVLVAGGILVIFVVSRIMSRQRSGQRTLSDDQLRAVRLRRELGQKLRALGIDPRGKSVGELREALSEEDWPGREDAFQVLASYNAVRFGARPLPRDTYGILRRTVRALKPLRGS